MAWEDTVQQWGTTIIDRWSSAEYIQPYEVEKLRLRALGDAGYYTEGQPGATQPQAGLFGMSQGATVLLIGGVLLAVFMLKE